MLYVLETMLQQCVALKLWSSLRIVARNITLKREIRHFHARRSRAVTAKKCTKKRDGCAELLFCQAKLIAFLPFSLTSLPWLQRSALEKPSLGASRLAVAAYQELGPVKGGG